MTMDKKQTRFLIVAISFITSVFVILSLLNLFYLHSPNLIDGVRNRETIIATFLQQNQANSYGVNTSNNSDTSKSVVTYAFMGSSHTFCGVDSEYIDSSLNLGLLGGRYVEGYYTLHKLVERDNISISYLLLELDPQSFLNYSADETMIIQNLNSFSPYVTSKDIASMCPSCDQIGTWFRTKYPILGNGFSIGYSFIHRGEVVVDNRDFSLSANRTLEAEKQIKASKFSERVHISDEALFFFDGILDIAQKHNITVLFVKYPLTREYVTVLNKTGFDQTQFYNELKKHISLISSNEIRILDYQSLFFNHPEFFLDSDHLNIKGALNLSQKIQFDLDNLS